jgi:transcriptional regulator with XRE-family HTH domain
MTLRPLSLSDQQRLAREAQRFTERELAEAIGASRLTIARARLGERLRKLSRVKIAAYLA